MGLSLSHPCRGLEALSDADKLNDMNACLALHDKVCVSPIQTENNKRNHRTACYGLIGATTDTQQPKASHTLCLFTQTWTQLKAENQQYCFVRTVGYGKIVGRGNGISNVTGKPHINPHTSIPKDHVVVEITYPRFERRWGQLWHAPENDVIHLHAGATVQSVIPPHEMSQESAIALSIACTDDKETSHRNATRRLPFECVVIMADQSEVCLGHMDGGTQKKINYITTHVAMSKRENK